LLALLQECQLADVDSVALLEAWLDRAHPDWRAEPAAEPRSGAMTRAEALEILGLAEGADEDAIRAAHRRLMRSAHPDQGGSAWLAARINAARDFLLG
jgi:curved DNA-binding protein CbpA